MGNFIVNTVFLSIFLSLHYNDRCKEQSLFFNKRRFFMLEYQHVVDTSLKKSCRKGIKILTYFLAACMFYSCLITCESLNCRNGFRTFLGLQQARRGYLQGL